MTDTDNPSIPGFQTFIPSFGNLVENYPKAIANSCQFEPCLHIFFGYLQSRVGWSPASSRVIRSFLCKTWLMAPSE